MSTRLQLTACWLYAALLAMPADAVELGNVMAIDAGYGHTCALDASGDVRCWGRNHEGQLGNGTQIDRRSAGAAIVVGGPALAIATGAYHTCAITAARTVKCWGYNLHGQLGSGSDVGSLVPVGVAGLDGGENVRGQLGTNAGTPGVELPLGAFAATFAASTATIGSLPVPRRSPK